MFFYQMALDGLGCFSYMIGSRKTGACAVVDPQRDVDCYLKIAAAEGLTITHVIETHVHADHVSGCCELAARTGATIYIHAAAGVSYPHVPLHDGSRLVIGECVLDVLHTPGHTRDSICLLVSDRGSGPFPQCVLTGDTLLLGDVGRPDLVPGESAEAMAGLLYDSLHAKLLTLPDELPVFPGHGAGSLCGRGLRRGSSSTIGAERRSNEALQAPSREVFVARVLQNQPQRPANYTCIKGLNAQGAPALSRERPRALAPQEAMRLIEQGHVLVDLRDPAEYARGHARGALNIPVGQLASRAGQLPQPDMPLLLMGEEPDVGRAVLALARIGYDRVAGFVEGGIAAWRAAGLPTARLGLRNVVPHTIARLLGEGCSGGLLLLDVREPWEWMQGHLPGAMHIPLGDLERRAGEVDPTRPVVVYCKGGVRSQQAAMFLAQRGHEAVYNLAGGLEAWRAAGLPIVAR